MTCHDDYDDVPLQAADKPVYVVGIDGSPASAAALRWATSRSGAAEVRAVYVYNASNLLPAAHAAYLPSAPPALFWERQAAQQQAEAFVAAALPGNSHSPVLPVAVEGDPRHALVAASHDADVLVLGASHRTAFGTRVLGSTSSTCAAHAGCPVMVVPQAWSPRRTAAVTAPAR
jgi:nucleotide-binding universal stress UspA family protein